MLRDGTLYCCSCLEFIEGESATIEQYNGNGNPRGKPVGGGILRPGSPSSLGNSDAKASSPQRCIAFIRTRASLAAPKDVSSRHRVEVEVGFFVRLSQTGFHKQTHRFTTATSAVSHSSTVQSLTVGSNRQAPSRWHLMASRAFEIPFSNHGDARKGSI